MPDLTLAKRDVRAFSQMIGRPLEEWQADALRLEQLTSVIVAARQSGKSRSLAVLATWWAYRKPGQRVLIISAGEEAAKRLMREIRNLIADSPLLRGSVVDEATGLITLSNGSEIRCVPASERQVRGWTVDLLLIDEAGSPTQDLILSAAFPTVAARPEARIVLADSAWAAQGVFYDQAVAGDRGSEHVRTFRWALEDATWISPSHLAAQREALGEVRFAAEYQGEFASGFDQMFSRELLGRCAAPLVLRPLWDLVGPARVLGGCDWGASHDRSALVAVARYPVAALNPDLERPVYGIASMQRWEAGAPLPDVVEEIAACPAHFAVLTSEKNGIGQMPTQLLFRSLSRRSLSEGGKRPRDGWSIADIGVNGRVEHRSGSRPSGARRGGFSTVKLGIDTSAELKSQTYGRLRYLMERGQFVLPAETELLRELLALRVELRTSGSVNIEARTGHDDLADCLLLAAAPYRRRGQREWRSVLTDHAERPTPEPIFDVAERDLVQTGGGLTVPRFPALQSVAGRELTAPSARREPAPGSDEEAERDGWNVERRGGARFLTRKTDRDIAAYEAAQREEAVAWTPQSS